MLRTPCNAVADHQGAADPRLKNPALWGQHRPVYEMPHKCNIRFARVVSLFLCVCVCVDSEGGSRIPITDLSYFNHVNLTGMQVTNVIIFMITLYHMKLFHYNVNLVEQITYFREFLQQIQSLLATTIKTNP